MRVIVDFPAAEGRGPLSFARPRAVLAAHRPEQVAQVLDAAQQAAEQGAWVVGMVAYEAASVFDKALQVRPAMADLPLAVFAVYDQPAVLAEAKETLIQSGPFGLSLSKPVPSQMKRPPAQQGLPFDRLRANGLSQHCPKEAAGNFHCGPWAMEIDRRRFDADLATLQADILAGRFYQTNHTSRLRSAFSGDAEALFRSLQSAQPGGYGFYMEAADWQVLSVSPELFFDWRGDGVLTTRPMKGTAPRGRTEQEDCAAAEALRASAKEQAENLMIVDLLRNDLSRVAQTGSVEVPALFALEALPSLWQMTSTVQCATRPGTTLAQVFAALFPCGSVTGAPKVTAMQSIAERELSPRGPYCGALGVIRPGGHATFSVGIRTVVVRGEGEGRQAECGIGSGITADATAEGEFAEWQAKRRFLLRASAGFQLIETLRLEAGEYWLLERHLSRLAGSAAHFGFAWEEGKVKAALETLAAAHADQAWRVRLLLDREGGIVTEAHALEPTPTAYAVALAREAIASDEEFLRHKTTERGMYQRHPIPADCFDVLLYNERDELTEFTKGNLVVEVDGRRLTPAASCGLLPGVLRAELLARGEITEAVIPRAALAKATGLWFINGVRGQVPAFLSPRS